MIDIDFSIKGGAVTFDDFFIKEGVPLDCQLDDLKEDMLQVKFHGGYIFDVGWRPSFEVDGKFYVVLIENYNWDNPIYSGTAKSLCELKDKITEALSLI